MTQKHQLSYEQLAALFVSSEKIEITFYKDDSSDFGYNAPTMPVDTTQYMAMIQAIKTTLAPDQLRAIQENCMQERVTQDF